MSDDAPNLPLDSMNRRSHSIRFSILQRNVQQEVEIIGRYLVSVTSAFETEYSRYDESLKNIPDDLPVDQVELLAEDHAEIQDDYVVRFPAFAHETTFVSTYSFLECQMMNICRSVGCHLKIRLGPEELKDKGIVAAKTYLEKLCGITVPSGTLWNNATQFGVLRNIFTHSGGRVKADNKPVQQYVTASCGKLAIRDGRLQISRDFCSDVLDNVKELLESLLRLAQARINEK